jgi:uncharacterized protein YjdB
LVVGSKVRLSLRLAEGAVTWLPHSNGVLRIDAAGVALAVKAGDTEVRGTDQCRNTALASVQAVYPVKKLATSKKTVKIKAGKTKTIAVRAKYAVAAHKGRGVAVTWKASKPKIASLDKLRKSKGTKHLALGQRTKIKVAAGHLGKSKITLTSQDGKKLVITVKVVKKLKSAKAAKAKKAH